MFNLKTKSGQKILEKLAATDTYTADHSRRVAVLTQLIAENMGWDHRRVKDLGLAGLLHDLGKTAIPREIIYKPARLDEMETAQMNLHPVIGSKMMELAGVDEGIIQAIRSHHERLDGSGYPYGLEGQEIDEASRVIAVADVYAAMTSDRPYRKALPGAAAFGELEDEKRYDQRFVGALKDILASPERTVKSGSLAYLMVANLLK